jgi:hypothetical protein
MEVGAGRLQNKPMNKVPSTIQTGLTLRALVIGLLLAFGIGVAGPFLSLYVQGANATAYFTSQMAHFLLFVLVGIVNVVLGVLRRSWILNKSELVVIFIFMSLANSTHTMVFYWVPMVSSPFYYARTENNWLTLIVPHIPTWLVPHDTGVIREFFEGSDSGTSGIVWEVWLEPLIGWLPIFVALPLASLCLMVILRRRWVDQERLIYPVMQLSLSMVQDDERSSLIKPFFRSGIMWVGFAIPMIVGGIIGLHAYFPFIPTIELSAGIPIFGGIRLSFATLGFFFLIQREVAFGLWVFTLLNKLQDTVYHGIGWGIEQEPAISVWSYGMPSLVHQGMGAMIVLVLGSLWVGREHLINVFRKAFFGAPEVDDSDEIVSYRGAVFGLLGSVGVMTFWLWCIGIPLPGVLVFLFFMFIIFVALTRVIAEGGVAVIYTPMVPADAAMSAIGTTAFGSSGLVGLTFARVLGNDILNFTMPHIANGLKLSGEIEGKRRLLFWGMLLAILLGSTGALWMLLYLTSTYGAINMRPGHFVWLPNYMGDYMAARINNPEEPNWLGWFHTGIGSGVMVLLLLARRFWGWWPLHPIGFPISSTFHWMAFNAFLAWLFKGPILRYGGVAMYRTMRPFFLGLILGHFTIYGVFWVVDAFTGMTGNGLFP